MKVSLKQTKNCELRFQDSPELLPRLPLPDRPSNGSARHASGSPVQPRRKMASREIRLSGKGRSRLSNVFNPITVSDIDELKILLLCASKPDSCHEPGKIILVAW